MKVFEDTPTEGMLSYIFVAYSCFRCALLLQISLRGTREPSLSGVVSPEATPSLDGLAFHEDLFRLKSYGF